MKTKSRVLTGISCILIALMCILSIVACGDEPENNECAHEWGEWETTTPATCTEAGVQTRVCAHNSEHTETRSIKANGHSYGEYVSDENASCTADGTKTATCEVCSKTDTVIDEGSALDHDYSISVVDEKYLKSAANCTDKAVYYKTCACGAVSEEDTFEYGSVAHSYKTELSKDETHHWYECSECADKSSVKAHNWDLGKVTTEPTATKEGKKLFTCSDCGQTKETSVPKKSHAHAPVRTAAVAATCYKDGNIEYWYCAGCGKYFSNSDLTREVFEENLVVPALNHKNITVELVVKAGCETPGYTTYGCADCDYTYDVEIPATGHSWAVSSTIEADCQTIGYTLHECSACHEQKKTDITPKTDCEETSAVTKEASCTENGEITYTCSTCGGTRTETIAKSGHEYDSVVTAPTCTTDGYTTHTCIHGCGSVYTDTVVKTSGHNWNTTHVDETCTTPGSDTSVCSVCNEVQTVVIPASGHDWVAATCTADGYCETCNAPGEPCHGHNYADEIDNVAASCSANGYIEYACTYEGCDSKTRTTPEDYKAKGHNLEAITWDTSLVLVDADHCMYANERSGVCPDCHETVKNTSEPFEKHAYVAAITTAATCCEGGLKTYTCKDCGHSYEEGYAKVDDAHSWGTGVLQADGVTTVYTCANDHSHTKVSVSAKQETETTVSASGIKNSNDVELKNATFVPSEELKDSIGESEDVKLSADILKDDAYDNAMSQLSQADRDRLKQGNIFNFTMEVGNQQLSNLGGAMTVRVPYTLDVENGEDPEDIVIAYINGSKIELKEAVYMEIDNQGYAVFETTHFSYYTVTKLTAEERCAIYGHVESTKVVPATCLTDGYTVTVCLRCGKKTVKDIVAALGHNWMLNEATHVEHSCTVDGVEEYECSRCQIDYKVVTKALGHNWYADEENTYGASCTEAGANAYKCDVCSGTYTETIPAIGHDFVDVEIKQATCVEGGYTDRECQSCGERIRTDVTNPTEHNIIDVVVAPTCVEKGYTAHYCDECGKTFANTNETDVVAHKWNIKKADCVTDKVCTVCNARGEKAHGHSMTKDGMCEHCGMPCEHDYVLKGTIDSTCVSRGYDVYVCSVCLGTHHGNYKDLADHEYKFVETVAPTCAKEGYDVYACEHCKIKTYRNYTDKVEHQYTFSYTIDATCSSPEYRVDECSVCGKTKKTETAPALSHVFENGKCKNCGISSDLFYLTMLNSWSNVKGAAFKLNNLSVITENLDTKFADGSVWVESENISLIKIPELMLYVDDDGKLCGAAYGALSIVEGVGMSATVYSIKAVIEGDDIYIEMSEETNGNAETYYVRVSIEYIMSQMLSESGLTEVASWAAVYVLPIISNLNGESAEFLDNFIGSLINMLFSKEETVDATVYSLDFEKLSELNENIAALNVGELVDTYFGEGFYAKLAADLEKLMAVNVSDILDYLDEAGVPKDKVVAAIDSLLAIAMNEEFSIEEMLQSPELEGVTVADMLSAMLEVEEFDIAALMEQLADINIYEQMGSVSQAKAAIKSIIEMVEDSIGLSFAVNAEGKTTEINLDVKDLVVGQSDSYRITLSAGIDITIDGRIEVSWSDIADKIDGMIPEDVFVFDDEVVYSDPEIMGGGGNRPDEDYCDIHYDKDGDGCCDKCGIRFEHYEPVECDHYDNDGDGCCDKCGLGFAQKDNIIDKEVVYKDINLVSFEIDSGVVEYKGKEYMVESIWYEQSRCTYVYSEFVAVMIMQDCGDWVSYDLVFKTVYDSVNLQMIYLLDTETENPSYILIYNEETDEQIEISLDYENESMTALFPDGTVADINPEMQMSDLGEYYPEDWWVTYRTSSENETIYYNSATGEVEFESQHKYELDEEKSFAAENCGDYGCYYYVCTECGDIDSHNYRKNHTHIWKYVLNENSNSCEEGVDEVLICVECGHIDHREENVRFEHCESNCITYENGDVYSAIICSACGKQMSAKEKIYTLITDENLVPNQDNLMGSYDKGSFIFVPSKTGIYELYSNGYGSAYVQNNDGYHMSGDLGSGIELYLEEGVSYKITINYIYGKGEASVYFNARTVREIDLAQYGSDCGGKIIVTSRFLEVDVQLECNCAFESMNDRMSVCSECGFKFFVDEGYTLDECCNEIVYCVYRFGKSEAEFNQNAYEVYAYKTGSVNHSAVSEHNNGRYESVDEYGNPITIEYEEKIDTCENCHKVVDKYRREYTRGENGSPLWEKRYYYEWSSALGEIYLSETSYSEYVRFAQEDGPTHIKERLHECCYYNNDGEVTYWYRYEYVYEGCTRWSYYTDSNGETREEQSTEHLSRDNQRTECYETVDENGNIVTVLVATEEYSCIRCGEAVSRLIHTTHYDEHNNIVFEKFETYELNQKYNSLYLTEERVSNYGVAYGVNDKSFSYILSCEGKRYDDNGEVYYTESFIYNYSESFCRCQEYYTNSYGEERYSKEENHNIEWIYRLHDGASDCTEGVDYMCICLKCGEIYEIYENYMTHHIEVYKYFYENGAVFRQVECDCCGNILEAKKEYASVDTSEELVISDRFDDLCFEFIASESALYEFYSSGNGQDPYGYIMDIDGNWIVSDDDYLKNANFGITVNLVAGETYYLCVSHSFEGSTIHFNKVYVEEVDLGAFGCECGGALMIYYTFGSKSAEVQAKCNFNYTENPVCENCGFSFYCDNIYDYDEFCNEIQTYSYFFKSRDDEEFTEYVIYNQKTGYYYHSNSWEEINSYDEFTDGEGNYSGAVEVLGYKEVCENCGHITYLEKTTYTYDSDKVCIEEKFERYEYSSNLNSAYLSYESVTKREKVAYDGGFETIENHYSYACYDDNGNIYESYSRDVVRSEDNPCRVDYIINDNGDEYTNVEYLHLYSWKTLEDECSEVNATDEYGNPIRIITYSEEKYCDKCYGSFEKNVQIKTEDVNGCEIKHENQIWKSYANSDTDFGYYLYEAVVSERGVFEYSEGKRATYITRYSSYIYDADGNVIEGSARVYDYTYGNYCHALVTETPVNGEVTTYEYNQHVDILCAWRLKEGSHSCFDGVEKYYYCVSCDYEEVSDTAKYHVNSNLNPTIINIADYGASCGGCIEIYYCPCRERAFVNNCFNCDMDVESQWYKDVEGKENHYKYTYTCAVTDPEQCRFAYTEETWSAYDEQCRRTQYYVYTFGINTDNPLVISYKISENYSNHSFSNEILDNDDQIVDGITKNTVHGRNCCVRCGFVESYFTEVKTYDENRRYLSRDYTVELYNNSGEMTSKSIYSYIVAYANDGHYSEFQTHYIEYFYDENGTINNWFEREYNYPNGYCRAVVTERNSNGYEYTYFENHCIDYYDEVIQQPTCSQKGKYNRICYWCEESFEFDENPNGHSYEYMDGEYVCCICGIHNANGADGNVILEDLTEEYGYGEYIVMGYFFRWSFDYVVVASLVVDGVEEPIILETVFAEDDGESIIRVSIANLAAEAEMLGYSISDVNVKLNIVPLGGGTEFDYAITFDAIAAE